MNDSYLKIKEYILEIGYNIDTENEEDGIFVISAESDGISKLVIGCAPPIVILEQFIIELNHDSLEIYKSLLMKNRDMIHGAFVLDESGKKVIFRDTLQVENLDLNELEGSINSLSLLLSEYSDELIKFSKQN